MFIGGSKSSVLESPVIDWFSDKAGWFNEGVEVDFDTECPSMRLGALVVQGVQYFSSTPKS